ncbi:hypothetical protein FHG87_005870 [Trinorchestia longiramus]|nr:hypothetical protein FHG87_005870 [Trinorchestia longiramus]
MVDEKVKMADINMKMEEEIKRLKAEAVSLRRELEDERKLKGEDARSKRKVYGVVNDDARHISGAVYDELDLPVMPSLGWFICME